MNIGAYEPTDAECDWPSDDDDELAEEIKDKVGIWHFLSELYLQILSYFAMVDV